MTARTYPPVASVTTMIPIVAQERLRGFWGWPWQRKKRQAVYWLTLGMGIAPEKAVVDLKHMQVTHTL